MMTRSFSRLVSMVAIVLGGAFALAACGGSDPTAGPTAAPGQSTSPPVQAAWEKELQETIAAAEREGELVITLFRQPDRVAAEAFSKAYPKIKVDAQIIAGREISARLPEEQAAGIFNFDIFMSGSTTGSTILAPRGLLGDTRANLFLPEVLEDRNWWSNDFDDWWADDTTKKFQFTHVANSSGSTFRVNTQVAPDVESLDDWLNPKYKGRVCLEDPRTFGGGDTIFTNIMIFRGTDFHRRLLVDTEPKISRDLRQLAADTVRGDCAISVGGTYTEFENQGVVGHLKEINLGFGAVPPEFKDRIKITCCGTGKSKTTVDGQLSSAVGGPALVTGAPHPNAAKLFLNWFLTRDGQMAWAEANNFDGCSARADMRDKCNDADKLPDPNGAYLSFNYASNADLRNQARAFSTEVLGR